MVLNASKIIDVYIDPPVSSNFYPPDTFLRAKIERKISSIGGYFIRLPNGNQGFLKSKSTYIEGSSLILQSKIFYELQKPQLFTDTLKVISKYFILKLSKKGISFSKKLPKKFERKRVMNLLKSNLNILEDTYVICRSSIASVEVSELKNELEKAIKRMQKIKSVLSTNNIYYDGLARQISLEKYGTNFCHVIEEKGIFDRLGIWDQLMEIREGKLNLKNGSYLIFEQTNAFLTIDVNSGKNHKLTKKEINLSACNEIARVIQGFGFGGKILIDFLPCSKEDRKDIFDKISMSFSKETEKNRIWGWTNSGIFELERKREKIPLKLLF